MFKSNTVKANVDNHPEIEYLMASNVVLSEGLLPYRVVLVDLGDKFATYNERVYIEARPREEGITELSVNHMSFDHGNYFEFKKLDKQGFSNWPERPVALENARQDFKERCAKVRVW